MTPWSVHNILANIPLSGSTQLLAYLFGGEVYNIFGGGGVIFHGPQETMLTLFGALIIPVAVWLFVILVLYFLVAGVVNSAQSGKFMLSNWNGFWPWVRMIGGLTAVVPSLTMKNLVMIQTLVLAIALLASSVADLVWQQTLSVSAKYGLTTQKVLTPSIDTQKTDAYLNSAFSYVACAANNIVYSNTDPSLTLSTFDPIHPDATPATEEIAKRCAGNKFLTFLQFARNQAVPQVPDLTIQPGTDVMSNDQVAKLNQYQAAQFSYLENQTILTYIGSRIWPYYTSNMDAIGDATSTGALGSDWQNILKDFHQDLQAKIASAILSDKSLAIEVFSTEVSKYGWISAANYYRQLAQQQQIINSQITSGLQNSPNYIDPYKQQDLTGATDITKFHTKRADTFMQKVKNEIAAGSQKYLLDPLGINFLKMGATSDPILAMTNFGQKIEGLVEITVVGRQAAKMLSWIPFLGRTLSTMLSGPIINFLLLVMTVAGLILGVILPNLPWIIFMFAIISWLIYVVEMFIAAPFWIVANALPEGGTLLSNVAKKGINNVLFIFLFPTLAIGGLVASLGISWIGIRLLNHFAYLAFKSLVGWTIPFDMVGIIVIYTVLAWTIMSNSLGLIQSFPRTILNWLSLSQPGMNQFDNAHQGAQNTLVGVVNPGGAIRKGGSDLVKWEKDRALKKSNEAKSRLIGKQATTDDEPKR